MKTGLICIFMLALSISFAQERREDTTSKRKEIHVRIQDFSPFQIGLNYKQQVKPRGYVTISLVRVGGGKTKSVNDLGYTNTTSEINGGLQIGYEFRREFKERFTFYHGPNLGYVYGYQKTIFDQTNIQYDERKRISHSVVVPYNVGLMYQFHKNILVSAQVSPQFTFTKANTTDQTQSQEEKSFNFGFSNLAGTLALVFRFNETEKK